MKSTSLFGINFSTLSVSEVVKLVLTAKIKAPEYIVTPNVDFVVRYNKNNEFKNIVDQAYLRVADGTPIIWFDKLFKKSGLKERVTGADLLPAICAENQLYNRRILFIGGLEGVARIAAQKLHEKYPNANIVDTYSPEFGFEKSETKTNQLIKFIHSSKPDIVFFGVGSPKQEFFIYKNLENLYPALYLCTGAAFDFVAGSVKRAPVFIQKIGLEWFWRFCQEPKRLFYRYFIVDSYFLILIIKEIFKTKRI